MLKEVKEMEFKRFAECTLDDVVTAWNRGFEGYYVQIPMARDTFLRRMVMEDLSPDCSIIVFSNGEPVGLVMNGIRMIGGKKVAWNGGTGIAASHRGTGLSNLLMEKVVEIYEEENIELATLEAIDENERAIKLYKKYGYEIIDQLLFLEKTISYSEPLKETFEYHFERILPEQLSTLPIYNHLVPWQSQWQSVKTGEAMLMTDHKDKVTGYALFKRVLNEDGQLDKLVLHQIHGENSEEVKLLLAKILEKAQTPVKVTTINFLASNNCTEILRNEGFEKTVGQVLMTKTI